MKFIAIFFLTIAFCLAVNAERSVDKYTRRSGPEVDCAKTVEDFDFRLKMYYYKLRDLTDHYGEQYFIKYPGDDNHNPGLDNENLLDKASEIETLVKLYQTRCQPNIEKVPGSGRFLQSVEDTCNQLKNYRVVMNAKFSKVPFFFKRFSIPTSMVIRYCNEV